ncbi:trypsin CFT-1-like [Spodoptera frugiperda]|uniref:trypsin n=1 Tax=Spodoptera frugiperda TaxID=7108 RepID=A0A9R0EZI2_SPOFR|nr:trypsin CFT-1-like [Spodoptera frugiperda]
MQVLTLLVLCVAAVAGAGIRSSPQRIWGGNPTSIERYPFLAALMDTDRHWHYWQTCTGAIINDRAVLTIAHCTSNERLHAWRIRVGTNNGNYAGVVHVISRHIAHPLFSSKTLEHNIAVLHVATPFTFNNKVGPVMAIAGPNYNVPDNENVLAVGWGWGDGCNLSLDTSNSYDDRLQSSANNRRFGEVMREVPLLAISQETCRNTYAPFGITVTDNMICAGWPAGTDLNSRGHCAEDFGAPLLHNQVIIGVFAFRQGISEPEYQSVHTRVSNYTSWINDNA